MTIHKDDVAAILDAPFLAEARAKRLPVGLRGLVAEC